MGIDIEKTRQYYESIKSGDMCDCNYCKNYRMQIKGSYPLVADYLTSFGIDIEKPLETSPLEPDGNGMIEYCVCQYVALGEDDNDLARTIGGVDIGIATSYPATNIPSEHFVLDIYSIKLKWV